MIFIIYQIRSEFGDVSRTFAGIHWNTEIMIQGSARIMLQVYFNFVYILKKKCREARQFYFGELPNQGEINHGPRALITDRRCPLHRAASELPRSA